MLMKVCHKKGLHYSSENIIVRFLRSIRFPSKYLSFRLTLTSDFYYELERNQGQVNKIVGIGPYRLGFTGDELDQQGNKCITLYAYPPEWDDNKRNSYRLCRFYPVKGEKIKIWVDIEILNKKTLFFIWNPENSSLPIISKQFDNFKKEGSIFFKRLGYFGGVEPSPKDFCYTINFL